MNATLQKKPKKKKIIVITAAILVAALILAWVLGLFSPSAASSDSTSELTPYSVTRGDITDAVTGSGTVEPIEQYEIQSIVTGDILEDYINVGDTVQEDDLLYVIDSTSAQNNIERSQKSYDQQLIAHNDKLKNWNEARENRTIYAPISGVITELNVKNGDSVTAGTKIAEIVNSAYLTVKIPFLAANAKNIYVNQAASVYIEDRNETISGYVSHVSTGTYATESGAVVSDVEITIKNPGALLPGESVTASVGAYACNDAGAIESSGSESVIAETSGDVTGLSLSVGDSVTGGNVMMTLSDETSDSEIRTSQLSLENAKLALDDLVDQLEDYSIRSPISGTVIQKTLKEGDTLDGNKTSLAIIADMSKLTFTVNVDELDIKNISVGQSVIVTADALPDQTFEGVIDTISIIGTSTNGVTVYPVDVVISEYEGLLPGMNVNAEIVTSEAKNVLMVPVSAVSRGNLVLVKDTSSPDDAGREEDGSGDSGRAMPDAPEGYTWKQVELGVSSEDFVEIVSGLDEGDEIFISSEQNASSDTSFGMGGMPTGGGMPAGGGMPTGGGMPSGGGMPTGGMPSGGGMPTGGMPSGGGMPGGGRQ